MLVDYKKRCLVLHEDYNLFIRYGVQAKDVDGNRVLEVRDLDSPYAALSRGGRRPGRPAASPRHFFNKRIMTDEEKIGGQARPVQITRTLACGVIVQGGGHVGVVGARNGERGTSGAQEAEAAGGSTWGRRRYFYHPESDDLFITIDGSDAASGLVEEVTEDEYNDIKRKQHGVTT